MKTRKARSAGWIAGSILVAAALLAPATALANEASQRLPMSWDEATLGSAEQCDGLGLAPGEVYWHILQNQVADDVAAGSLTATFQKADVVGPVGSYQKSGTTLHWGVVTGKDTVLALSTDVQSPGNLVVSHVCYLPDPTPAPTATPTQTPQGGTQPTPTPASSVEAATGTPKVTPPPTDSTGSGSTGSGWGIVLLALGGLAALALVATPARRRNR
jgi:hypothetical protein